MSSFLSRLKEGVKNTREIKFPGTDEKITLRVLSCAELQRCAMETEQWMQERYKAEYGVFNAETYNDEHSIRVLFTALSDAGKRKPISEDIDEFRAKITDSEKSVLLGEYNAWQDKCSPDVAKMTQKDFDKIVIDIKKKPETIGKLSNIHLLRRLLHITVEQLASLQTDSGL